jgi:hypothetical protein
MVSRTCESTLQYVQALEAYMRKALLAVIGAASILAAAIASPTKAEAGCRGCWVGAGIAAGVIGGAIIANNAYGYGYRGYGGYGYGGYGYGGYGYGGYAPTYYAPPSYAYGPAYYGYVPQYYYPRYGYGYGYGYRSGYGYGYGYRGYNRHYARRAAYRRW